MRNSCSNIFLVVGLCVIGLVQTSAAAHAGQAAGEDRRLPAIRALGRIEIDGRLDEADWGRAPVASGFIQNEPREGVPASEDTEVRVLYDADDLYIGVFAHDSEPTRIITTELTKDFNRTSGDSFEVILDTFHDRRNGYMFATNAQGAKWDAQMVNEGREINENWDTVWQVKTHTSETGWYAEIAIPLRTLRFHDADPQTWGINFLRRIRRNNEDTFWSPLPRIYDLQRVSLAGSLEELQGLRPGKDLRLKPYVLGSSGKSATTKVGTDADIGFDAKYGVTSGLSWDFTVNTDFSQVEADEQQVNLTRFSLFFPEKRDFFLENSGVYEFGGTGGVSSGGDSNTAGGAARGNVNNVRDPILFFSRRIGLSDAGQSLPILGGTRLSGRAGAYGLGVVNIQQQREGTTRATNFTALRLRRNVLANSDIGLLFLNKDVAGPQYNRVAGADANFRFFTNLNINTYAVETLSSASPTSDGRGVMTRAAVSYRDKLWDLRSSYGRVGKDANDELGYIERPGTTKVNEYFSLHLRPSAVSSWMREFNPHIEYKGVSYVDGPLQSRYVDYHIPINFQSGAWLETGANAAAENLISPFVINRRRGIAIAPGRYDFTEWFFTARSDASRPLSLSGRWGVGDFYDGYKQNYAIAGAARVGSHLNASLNLTRNQISLRGGRYSTNLVTGRIEYGFSTQAFVNALVQYNTDAREWSSNIRFNVIHHPLSDFYLVFNDRRDIDGRGLIDRAVIAKMTYMVAF
jgi:hypothetical protein